VVDVSDMHVDDTLHISDLKAIEGVEFLDDPDQPVVSCGRAVVEVEPVASEAEVAPGAVPVVGEEEEESEEDAADDEKK